MKNSPSPSPLFDEFVKTLPPYGGPRDAEIAALRQQLETERMRLAACGTAALGYFDGCKDEYKSASLDDVLRLRQQLAECELERDELVAALDYVIRDLELRASLNPDPDERDIIQLGDGAYRQATEALAKLGADKTGEK